MKEKMQNVTSPGNLIRSIASSRVRVVEIRVKYEYVKFSLGRPFSLPLG